MYALSVSPNPPDYCKHPKPGQREFAAGSLCVQACAWGGGVASGSELSESSAVAEAHSGDAHRQITPAATWWWRPHHLEEIDGHCGEESAIQLQSAHSKQCWNAFQNWLQAYGDPYPQGNSCCSEALLVWLSLNPSSFPKNRPSASLPTLM